MAQLFYWWITVCQILLVCVFRKVTPDDVGSGGSPILDDESDEVSALWDINLLLKLAVLKHLIHAAFRMPCR